MRLGIAATGRAARAAIVATRAAVIPVAGVVRNYNILLGHDGISGIKTGNTAAAGGCVLLAVRRQVGMKKLLIVAASFGQLGTTQTMLPAALNAGDQLILGLDR